MPRHLAEIISSPLSIKVIDGADDKRKIEKAMKNKIKNLKILIFLTVMNSSYQVHFITSIKNIDKIKIYISIFGNFPI